HMALDSGELACACGTLIEDLLGSVRWRVRFGNSSNEDTDLFFGGTGATIEPQQQTGDGSLSGRNRVDLRFRDEVIGALTHDGPPVADRDTARMLGAHLGAAGVNLRLWTRAEEESRERRLGHEMLGDISALLGSFDIEFVLARSLEHVLRIVGSDVGSVMLWDGCLFSDPVVLGLPEEVTAAIRLEGEPVAELVAKAGQSLVVSDPDLSGLPEEFSSINLQVLLAIPLMSGNRAVAVMQTANPRFCTPGSPYLEAAEEICQLSAIAVENAALHKEVVQRERMATIGQVMAGLSHDIKNMLHTMNAGYYLLRMGIDGGDMSNVSEAYPILGSAMQRISGLVMDMLDYSKNRTPARSPVALNALGEEIVSGMKPVAEDGEVTLEHRLDPAMEMIAADSNAIFRCLSNLVTNAVQAVEKGGRVEVRTEWRDGEPMASIVVEDDGPGIPEEDRGRIFDALFSTKGSKGTGFGLAVTKKIVEEHGGRIDLDSELGRGTTFTICLPKEA
ncbi:MAG: GAF domain-containing protein, partial [Candidatus Eisenbacteria sp.]|nr:GAF domain-containing protein [Candidatus Eisenbacteria bacterium]